MQEEDTTAVDPDDLPDKPPVPDLPSDDELEDGCDGQGADKQLEPVLMRDVADSASAHVLNVSHGRTRRLLPE